MPSPELLDTNEAAARLGVKPKTVAAWCRYGFIAAQLIGGRWWLKPASVEAMKRRIAERKRRLEERRLEQARRSAPR